MTDYKKINYDKKTFYIDVEEEDVFVYDREFKKLTSEEIKKMGFYEKTEFFLFLKKLLQKPKTEYLEEADFRQILSENFIFHNLKLSSSYMTELASQVNYKTIKKNDFRAILNCLEKITSKNKNLCYDYLQVDMPQKITLDRSLRNTVYFKQPFGRIVNNTIYGIPLIFPTQINLLLKNNN